jgi:acyl-homoserine-lactone acylase
MVRAEKLLSVLLTVLAACAPLQRLGIGGPDDLADHVTITRDEWGVPHIEGDSDVAAMFGLAYAMAEDSYRQIEEEHIHALGRAAHWYGPDFLAADMLQAAFEVERLSREEYEREPGDRKALWDAFAAGLNHYLLTSGERPRLIVRWEPWMLLARARSVAPGTIVDGVRLGTATFSDGTYDLPGAWDPAASQAAAGPQSAAWAVAPARTAAGHALLLHATDATFSGPGQYYEAQVGSAGWRVHGFMPLGAPVVRAGHNDRLAWAHTESDADVADVYEVAFDHPTDPLLYRHGAEWRRAEAWQDTLLVNTESGVSARVVSFRRTHHGPIVAQRDGRALAVRSARMGEGGALQQWLAMARARSIDEFRVALDQRALPGLNTLYADVDGNLYYLHGNAVPVRDTALDWTRPVDGGDPRSDWRGYHSIGELPELLNPASGRVVSVGGTAFAATSPDGTEIASFPEYVTGAATSVVTSTLRRLLAADTAWTLDALASTAFDATAARADDEIMQLSLEWEQVGGRNPIRARALDAVIDTLREWDRVTGTESAAATLYVLWQERLHGGVAGELARFRAMEDVVAGLEQRGGTAFIPWGEVNRLRREQPGMTEPQDGEEAGLPLAGAPGSTGAILRIEAEALEGSGRRAAVRGRAWIGAVELSSEMHSRWIVPFGQSGRPDSPHWFDQAALFARSELRPARALSDTVPSARGTYSPPRLR